MKRIVIPFGDIIIDLDETGGGSITSSLHVSPEPDLMSSEVEGLVEHNAAIDGLESLILGHACAGIDVESPEYIVGIETAEQAIGNNFS